MIAPTAARSASGSAYPRIRERVKRLLTVGGWLVLVATFAGEAASILRADLPWLIARMPDDAFYYIRIGQNLARGNGSTFDGVHLTNGFHPLWEAVCTLCAVIIPSGTGLIRLVLLVGLAFAAAAAVLLVRLAARVVGTPGALFAAIVALHGPVPLSAQVNGMEGAVVVFALAVVATVLRRCLDRDGADVWLGVAGAVLVLARLDLILVVWIPVAVVAWRRRDGRVALRWAAGLAAIGLPVATAWLIEYGHVLSVSGTVKQAWMSRLADQAYGGRLTMGFARQVVDLSRTYARDVLDVATATLLPASGLLDVLGWLALLGPASYGATIAGRRVHWRRPSGGRRGLHPATLSLLVLVGMVVAKSAIDLVFSTMFSVGTWYSAPEFTILPMVLGLLAWVGLRRMVVEVPAVAAVALVALAVTLVPAQPSASLRAGSARYDDSQQRPRTVQAVAWITRHHLVARFGFTDTGVAAWLIPPPSQVVNLDGFVNDYTYAGLVNRQAPLAQRLAREGIEVLLVWAPQSRVSALLPCGQELWSSSSSSPDDDQQLHIVDVRPCALTRAARLGESVATHPGLDGAETSTAAGPTWGDEQWLLLLASFVPAAAVVLDARRRRRGRARSVS